MPASSWTYCGPMIVVGNAVAFGQPDGGSGALDGGLRGVQVGPARRAGLDQGLLVDRRDVRGEGELAERLGLGGGLRDADLVAEVGQGGDVILPGRLGLLAGGPALDLRQRDVGGLGLVRLQAPFERLEQVLVEVASCSATRSFSRR